MRIAAGLIAGFLASTGAAGAGNADERRPTFDPRMEIKLMELEARARQMYPSRRDTPLRYLNITDDEIREVNVIATKYHMPDLVNISPVVTGCPCEEGGACTEQVYITSLVNQKPVGLQLSRRKNLWTVGVVQKWWLEFAALKARESAMSRADYQKARMQVLLSMPVCADPAKSAASPPKLAEAKTAK